MMAYGGDNGYNVLSWIAPTIWKLICVIHLVYTIINTIMIIDLFLNSQSVNIVSSTG